MLPVLNYEKLERFINQKAKRLCLFKISGIQIA
jgi:hypothetical protein